MSSEAEDVIARRLAELHARPGFWRERWRAAGHTSAPETLHDLPIVTPEELTADERAHPPYGSWRASEQCVRVGIPATPRVLDTVFFTADDLDREASAGARALAAAGLDPGRRETNVLAGGLVTPGSLLVGDAAERLGSLDMPVGGLDKPAARAVAFDFWARVRPDFLVIDAAGGADFMTLLAEHRTSAAAIGIACAAVVADLRDGEPVVPDLGVPVTWIGGLAEAFSLMASRDRDGVFAAPPGEVFCEVLDGRLIVTTLHHSAALVRYAPGVRARSASDRDRKPAPAGRFLLG
jgi:hypothetical protein